MGGEIVCVALRKGGLKLCSCLTQIMTIDE